MNIYIFLTCTHELFQLLYHSKWGPQWFTSIFGESTRADVSNTSSQIENVANDGKSGSADLIMKAAQKSQSEEKQELDESNAPPSRLPTDSFLQSENSPKSRPEEVKQEYDIPNVPESSSPTAELQSTGEITVKAESLAAHPCRHGDAFSKCEMLGLEALAALWDCDESYFSRTNEFYRPELHKIDELFQNSHTRDLVYCFSSKRGFLQVCCFFFLLFLFVFWFYF
jgi:hypothetical protein